MSVLTFSSGTAVFQYGRTAVLAWYCTLVPFGTEAELTAWVAGLARSPGSWQHMRCVPGEPSGTRRVADAASVRPHAASAMQQPESQELPRCVAVLARAAAHARTAARCAPGPALTFSSANLFKNTRSPLRRSFCVLVPAKFCMSHGGSDVTATVPRLVISQRPIRCGA